ncbi:MAG TPA: hypothetical protein VJA21_33635 [Verrucomicrobiae bacterium]
MMLATSQFLRVANQKISTVAQEVRVADAVVVMGAGVSFAAGMPLAGHLSPLVWHALDSSPNALRTLCADLGVAVENAKTVIGDDSVKINRALGHIKKDETALRCFKRSFCELNNSRAAIPSAAHSALARLVHTRKVVEVVSFNWDTLLECGFRRQFGFDINGQGTILWKPHGDCNAPDEEWVLPNEDGRIPVILLDHVTNLANIRPRVLVIIGYSEEDEAVVRRLIGPLANCWRVFRVGPSANGEGAITSTAAEALEQLAAELVQTPYFPGWSTVIFDQQRGVEAAVAGERLGAGDVQACPRLPHYVSASEKLSLLHFVEVAGESGSGKSITVWQLAYEFHRQGWQVLRLDAAKNTNQVSALDTLKAQTWKTVAVVDDSQIFSAELLAEIRATAGKNTKVVFGTTDETSGRPEAIRAATKAAVEVIADTFRTKRATVLPIVREFDRHVGDGFLDTPIETRIEQASKEKTPWMFAYVLRGGFRRVRSSLDAAQDFQQADVLLLLIAARQLATLDAGSSVSDLIRDAKRFGRNESWVHSSLALLTKQRSILNTEIVRCLHLRSAASIIEASLETRKDQSYADIVSILQLTLKNLSFPLRGISWLLRCIWLPHYEVIATADIDSLLISRCYEAKTRLEIRDACFVLEQLLGRQSAGTLTHLLRSPHLLRSWILEADVSNAYAVSLVINNLHNNSHRSASDLMEALDPKQIAEKIGAASPESGRVWGDFTSRVCVAGSGTWRTAVASNLPRDLIRHTVDALAANECEELPDYIEGLAGYDFDFALELLERAVPKLAQAIGGNSLKTYRELQNLPHWLLGEGLFMDMKPTKRQRYISKGIFDGLNPSEVIKGILTCRYGDWEYYARLLAWVDRAHSKKRRAIVEAMDWAKLDEVVSSHFRKPGPELGLLLARLVTDQKSGEPVAGWLFKHAREIKELSPLLATISPQTAVAVLNEGGTINLSLHHGWLLHALAIARIASLDEKAGRKVVEQNIAHIAKGVTELSLCGGMLRLLELVAEFPGLLDQVLDGIDLNLAKERWRMALTDHRPEERKSARATLAFVSARAKAEVRELANGMIRQRRFRKRASNDK